MRNYFVVLFLCFFYFASAQELPSFFPPKSFEPVNEWLTPSVIRTLHTLQEADAKSFIQKRQRQKTLFWIVVGAIFLTICTLFVWRFFPYQQYGAWQKRRMWRKKEKLLQSEWAKLTKSELHTIEYLWQVRIFLQDLVCLQLKKDLFTFTLEELNALPIEQGKYIHKIFSEIEPVLFTPEKAASKDELRRVSVSVKESLCQFW